jgi:hypothetical protein
MAITHNDLKSYSLEVIKALECPPDMKLKIIQELKEASPYGVINFLMEGEFIEPIGEGPADAAFRKFANDDVLQEEIDSFLDEDYILLNEGIGKIFKYGFIILTAAGWVSWRLARSIFDESHRKCGIFRIPGRERNICLLKYKIKVLEIKIKALNLNDCGNAKDTDKCKEQVDKLIKKYQKRIHDYKEKLDYKYNYKD